MKVFFGGFALDERARTLRLDGLEWPLQPLVFDLLVYLVHHRERAEAVFRQVQAEPLVARCQAVREGWIQG